jgi:hypothetical protein
MKFMISARFFGPAESKFILDPADFVKFRLYWKSASAWVSDQAFIITIRGPFPTYITK